MIAQGQVENLAAVFERTWQRPPSEAELAGLIQDRIDEEVLAREARALGQQWRLREAARRLSEQHPPEFVPFISL